jgi:hypothetical protein
MEDITSLGIWPIIAFFVPLLASLIKQSGWPTQVNAIVALVVYLVAGFAYVLVTAGPDGFTVDEVVASMTIATVVGTAAYNLFWSNLGVSQPGNDSIEERLMNATSFVKQ